MPADKLVTLAKPFKLHALVDAIVPEDAAMYLSVFAPVREIPVVPSCKLITLAALASNTVASPRVDVICLFPRAALQIKL